MRFSRCTLISAGLLMLAVPCFAGPKTLSKKHYHASLKHASARHRMMGSHVAGHREASAEEMPAERASQIQNALIKQGYLSGEPSGTWDTQTIAAMQKLQADNGWQSKITPDSRALIKLGLGPQGPATGPAPDQAHDIASTPQP
jgi:hypothetical protein